MENAAVCLFCLSDNIFNDERSIALFGQAVKLGKQCANRARARARVAPLTLTPQPSTSLSPSPSSSP